MLGMLNPNKKIGAVILASKGASGEEKLEQGPEVQSDMDPALESVASKLISAFEMKDKKSLISGLKEFMDIIQTADLAQDESEEMEME